MIEALFFMVKTGLSVFSLVFLLRFYLQVVRATLNNPLSIFVRAITDFAVVPVRRFVPSWRNYDLSTLGLALICEILMLSFVLMMSNINLPGITFNILLAVVSLSFISLIKMFVYIVIVVTFAQAILSWVNPYSPIMTLLTVMTSPFLNIFRNRVRLIGGVDLSPLFLLLFCQLILIWPVNALNKAMLVLRSAS
ncbi:MAG: YggT family protein [Betaproteobacteria bacterium]|nr:YggT family protein [Betaproteobacteria bacterium]